MSVSKWRYTEACDFHPCPGDCDFCDYNLEDELNATVYISDTDEGSEADE